MKRFSEQLYKKAGSVKLRAAEKRELRERVVSYMEYHPLPKEMKQTKAVKAPALMTEEYKEFAIPFKMLTRWAVGVAAIVIIAVPFAAERSVPGDGLYAVKRFNEDVRSTLAFNNVQKVEWETTLLNRRIAEARLLESEGRLTDEVEAVVVEAVRSQNDKAQQSIAALREEDEDEATLASIALETTLAVQSAALNEETANEETVSEQPSLLAAVVEESLEETNAANASSTIPAFDKVMAKVEVNTTRVYELRDSLALTATKEQIAEVNRRIDDIERSIAEAVALREEEDEAARTLLVDSLQRTQKLVVFMTDIEVSETVDIEEIVPVVLTDDEKNAIVAEHQTELDEKVAIINALLAEVEDADIVEKVNQALIDIETIMEGFTEIEDFEAKKTALLSALAYADDMLLLFEVEESIVPVLEEETASSTKEVASTTEEVIEEEETEEPEEVVEEEPEIEETGTTTEPFIEEEVSTEDVDTE